MEYTKSTRERPANREDLINRGAGSGWFSPVTHAELRERLAVISAAKRATNGLEFTNEELDRLLSPVNCRRTRLRLLGKP